MGHLNDRILYFVQSDPIQNPNNTLILLNHFYLFQGLRETKHPYMFVAREGFREMLEVDDAASRTLPILSKLIVPLRAALVRSDCCCVYVCAG